MKCTRKMKQINENAHRDTYDRITTRGREKIRKKRESLTNVQKTTVNIILWRF